MPRNSRLTPEIVDAILAALRAGKNVRQSCSAAKISRKTFYKWLVLGKNGEPGFAEFSVAVFDATAIGSKARLEDILAALQTASATSATSDNSTAKTHE